MKIGKIKSIKRIFQSADKYDLQTVNHNFFANGILVHNCTMYRDFIHARSLSELVGEDRGRVKALWAQIAHDIPEGWRLCGENLYATHSIHYKHLQSYFELFSVWNELNQALSWDETVYWAELLGVQLVPVIYRGIWDEKLIRSLYKPEWNGDECEGYVVRLARSFGYGEFRSATGKYVRQGHVTTETHWRHKLIIPNELDTKSC